MKRAVYGMHHSVSEAHLPRYLAERDFSTALKGIEGNQAADVPASGNTANA
jgi:hypothetical protein